MERPEAYPITYGILGLLAFWGPMSGYDIKHVFDHTLAPMWGAAHSQIYKELRRMKDMAWVEIRREEQEARPDRKVYFGGEADDPINARAFNRKANPMHARLNAFFSSDIGHFDVPDMTEVVPEAYELVEHGLLSDDDFRELMRKSIEEFSRSGAPKDPLRNDFATHISYVSGGFDDPAAFAQLREALERNDREFGTAGNRLFYLSTPPSVFATIVEQLDAAGLGPRDNKTGWSRIIVEKPFGTDLDSARALQAEVSKVFDEKQVYRIDHYLGKEPVQDIMALRFANIIFEPIWNRRYVDSVQITAAETVGVEQRGGYYDNAGALRDMIQNHVLNLLALVAMEPRLRVRINAERRRIDEACGAMRPGAPTLDCRIRHL